VVGNLGHDVAYAADGAVFSLDEVGYQAGPTGLMRGAEACGVITVEVLAEEDIVAPGGVGLERFGPAEARTSSRRITRENGNEAVAQVGCDLVEGQPAAGACRILDRQVIAEEGVIPLERADDEIVDREPDGPAPV